jgi:hypothetical protein
MRKKPKNKTAEFKKMVEEATVDCYTDEEAFMGMVYTLRDKLKFPFNAKVLGKEIKIVDIDDTKSSPKTGIMTKILLNGKQHTIPLSTIQLLNEKSKKGKYNKKWIDAFRWWAQSG